MRIDQAKNEINKLNKYIEAFENYKEYDLESQAFKLYAVLGNVTKVSKALNQANYKIGTRKIQPNDVSAILQNPADDFQTMVHEFFFHNKKKASRIN